MILERLESVKETGAGRWIARCPAHADKRPSLSIREIEGDRWLVHCFSGCQPLDICHALGIELADLFHDRQIRRDYQHGVDRNGKSVPRLSASDALSALDHEAIVIAIIGADFLAQREIDEPTWQRLAVAVRKISDARARCCPAKHLTPKPAEGAGP